MLLVVNASALAMLSCFRGNNSSTLILWATLAALESEGAYLSLNGMTPISSGNFTLDKLASTLCFLTFLVVVLIELTPSEKLLHPLGISGCLVFLALILTAAFTCYSPMLFYTLFEASLIPISVMVLGWGYQPERLSAVMSMMLYTMLASLPLLVVLLTSTVWSGNMFLTGLASIPNASPSFTLMSSAVFLAFLVKLPMFAVHLWLPKAHVEAPVGGSMFLAALLLKLGGYGLWRLSASVYASSYFFYVQTFALLGGACVSFLCLRQIDVKVLIAYSSVAHMSLALACLSNPSLIAASASLFMLLAHGVSSSAMFGAANLVYLQYGSRSMLLMGGTLSLLPVFSLFWFIILAANMAAPPSANLMAEIFSVSYFISTSSSAAVTFGIISFLAAAYSLLLYATPLQGQRESLATPQLSPQPLNFLFLTLHCVYFFSLLWLF